MLKLNLFLNLHLCRGGVGGERDAPKFEHGWALGGLEFDLDYEGGTGMEKERGLKKKTALSTCILQLYLCTSILIFAADKHVWSLFTLMPSLSPSLVFTLSVFQE